MTEPILHHYPASPFAEKARLMLGFKGLGWRSVHIPPVMPKPDVIALTGGYRRTPLLQIGADVYCDTALIARVLERLQPEPALFPADAPLAPLLAQWADATLFWTVIPYVMQPAGLQHIFAGMPQEAVQVFMTDRAAFTGNMRRQTPADAEANLGRYLDALEAQLADGRRHLFGERASIADFSVAHGLWYVRRAPPLAGIVSARPRLSAWVDRMLAGGHGAPLPMSSAEALAVARGAQAHAPTSVAPGRLEAGQHVTVTPTDYGLDPSPGVLVGLDDTEVVIARDDERAGRVHVHFPRVGFQVKAERNL